METFSERLRKTIESSGLSKSAIAEQLDVAPPVISRWLAGSVPKPERTAEIAKCLNVDVNWLMFGAKSGNHDDSAFPAHGGENPKALGFSEDAPRRIPVIGWAHAGQATCYEELPKDWQETIPSDCRDLRAFGVALEGDSMEPAFRDGDQLVLMPSEEAHSGCYAVCRFADDGVVFRRIEFMGDRIQLVPLNDRYYQPTNHSRSEFSWIYPIWERRSRHWK